MTKKRWEKELANKHLPTHYSSTTGRLNSNPLHTHSYTTIRLKDRYTSVGAEAFQLLLSSYEAALILLVKYKLLSRLRMRRKKSLSGSTPLKKTLSLNLPKKTNNEKNTGTGAWCSHLYNQHC